MEGLEGLCVYGYSGLIDIFFHAYNMMEIFAYINTRNSNSRIASHYAKTPVFGEVLLISLHANEVFFLDSVIM